jgi:S-adenosyl methyltransferase
VTPTADPSSSLSTRCGSTPVTEQPDLPGVASANHPAYPPAWMSAPECMDSGLRFDPSVPHPARVYAYWLGGKDHYAAALALMYQR